ncbi:hypothetical protein [Thermosulfurimonas dismutans]|uniref:Uncharacterized protein n=1 Tax=Thermosulfurimonas dismutans TaxID=999894 RepID=A0A179D2F1_9BACT|nr:hypothetical protein [Thermosulfurimonas dismutans]OAQ19879.1 hypothetical protein TDIS_2009 [Thermosulfurimonas dismutans]
MRFLKATITGIIFLILILTATYALLPRGYLFVRFFEKLGFLIYPERIKEGLFETRLFCVHFSVKGYHFEFPEVRLGWYELEVPCGRKGYLRVSYLPLKDLRIVFKEFEGRCAGREDFEKISGTLIYRHSEGLFGKLRVSGFRSPTGPTTVLLNFSGRTLIYNFPRLNIKRKIEFLTRFQAL